MTDAYCGISWSCTSKVASCSAFSVRLSVKRNRTRPSAPCRWPFSAPTVRAGHWQLLQFCSSRRSRLTRRGTPAPRRVCAGESRLLPPRELRSDRMDGDPQRTRTGRTVNGSRAPRTRNRPGPPPGPRPPNTMADWGRLPAPTAPSVSPHSSTVWIRAPRMDWPPCGRLPTAPAPSFSLHSSTARTRAARILRAHASLHSRGRRALSDEYTPRRTWRNPRSFVADFDRYATFSSGSAKPQECAAPL